MLEFTAFTKVTYKQKMLVDDTVLQITICEENRQLGKAKVHLHKDYAVLEHIAIDEYSRFNGYGELLLNKVVQVLQKKFEHIKTIAGLHCLNWLTSTTQQFTKSELIKSKQPLLCKHSTL